MENIKSINQFIKDGYMLHSDKSITEKIHRFRFLMHCFITACLVACCCTYAQYIVVCYSDEIIR